MLELFRSPRRTLVWCVEASLLVCLATCVAGIRVGWDRALGYEHVLGAVVVSLVALASLYYHGLYAREAFRTALIPTMMRALAVAAVIVAMLRAVLPHGSVGSGFAVFALGAAALVLPAWRTAFQHVSNSVAFRRTAIVLGVGPLARACAELLQEGESGLVLAGLLAREGEAGSELCPGVIGTMSDVRRIAYERGVSSIIVAASDRRGAFPIADLLELKFLGIDIEEGIDFYERVTGKLFVREVKPSHLIFAHGFRVRRSSLLVKRAFDVVCASLGLLLALPIMALTAIAIRLDSPGSIVYSQERAGLFGRPFMVHKFRSMRADAEAGGAAWATEDDPRVTRVGRFIRRMRIDELPQLWNVLVGDMSMVGPRPERPVFIEQLQQQIPLFRQRLFVKPGVTGHAQVRARYAATTEDHLEKLSYDLYYIKSHSLWFDLSILLDTVRVVLLRIGAR